MDKTPEQKLAKLGAYVLRQHREHLGDLDGGEIQDACESFEILKRLVVEKSCGEECRCAEYYGTDGFPAECMRVDSEVFKLVNEILNDG